MYDGGATRRQGRDTGEWVMVAAVGAVTVDVVCGGGVSVRDGDPGAVGGFDTHTALENRVVPVEGRVASEQAEMDNGAGLRTHPASSSLMTWLMPRPNNTTLTK